MRDPEPEPPVSAEAQDALTSLLVLVALAQAGDWQTLIAALPPRPAPARPGPRPATVAKP